MSKHNMLQCPICHEPTISKWQKLTLGPARSIRCSNCGGKVGVAWSSLLYFAPFLVLYIYSQIVGLGVISLFLLLILAIVTVVVYMKYVPLISKE